MTGNTASPDFPTTPGAARTTFAEGEAFVTKLNAAGSELVYSSYVGGSEFEGGVGIAVDGAGSAYVTGITHSPDFPTTVGAAQPTSGGGPSDAFVTKLNATGSALVFSTYLGGSATEVGDGIAVDELGNAFAMGHTYSPDFPTTAGAVQTTFAGGADVFVAK